MSGVPPPKKWSSNSSGCSKNRSIRFTFLVWRALTTYDDDEWVFDAIRGTMDGKSFVDPAVAGKLMGQIVGGQKQPASVLADNLTERELDVLRLLAKGFTNSDIAARLYLSEGTVRNHVSAILEKLGVSDRTQAAVIAIQQGL